MTKANKLSTDISELASAISSYAVMPDAQIEKLFGIGKKACLLNATTTLIVMIAKTADK